MNAIITIFIFLIFTKLFLFWLWLWQLKEYHLGRFLAHFEGQAIKKIISSLWRIKYPKFTKKIIVIFFAGVILAILMLAKGFSWPIFLLIILVPLFFQVPTVIWRNRILAKAEKKREQMKNLIAVGITGSFGKTSTKEFLATILEEKYIVLKTKEHQNAEVGVAQTILKELKPEHQIFVVEIGAYDKGKVAEVCRMIKPKIGIITGVNEQHLATFGTMENLLSAEGGRELIESLPEDGKAFFNGKNKYCRELFGKIQLAKTPHQNLRFGTGQAFLYGENAALLQENLEGAKAVARELGMTDSEISRGLEKIKNKLPAMEMKKTPSGLNIIDATYSANPDGVMAHLEYLKTFVGRKTIVMPCLIELGSASAEVHRKIGQKISEVCDLAIITTQDRFKEINETAGEKAIFLDNPKEIIERIKEFNTENDTILLEGRLPREVMKLLSNFTK